MARTGPVRDTDIKELWGYMGKRVVYTISFPPCQERLLAQLETYTGLVFIAIMESSEGARKREKKHPLL